MYVSPVQEKWRGQRAFSRKFESVPSLFLFVLKIFVCTVPPGTVLSKIKSKFVILKLWQLVVFCTCRIHPEGLKLVENVLLRERFGQNFKFQQVPSDIYSRSLVYIVAPIYMNICVQINIVKFHMNIFVYIYTYIYVQTYVYIYIYTYII